uniref:Uncharacterized protein n=1 Tax=Trichogramma kaykai TaxID=54128 RepID=A0ABD2XBU8_9HYME
MRHLLSSLHWRRRVREAGRRSSPPPRRLFFHRATKTAGVESTSSLSHFILRFSGDPPAASSTNSLERCHRTRSDDSEIKSKKMNNLYKRLDIFTRAWVDTNNTKEVASTFLNIVMN